jgi:hypothetical protein
VVPTPASASFPPTSTSSKFLSLESLFDTFDTPVQGSILEELEDEETSTHAQEVLTLRDSFFRSGPALFPTGTMMGSATKCDYVSFRNYILICRMKQ